MNSGNTGWSHLPWYPRSLSIAAYTSRRDLNLAIVYLLLYRLKISETIIY